MNNNNNTNNTYDDSIETHFVVVKVEFDEEVSNQAIPYIGFCLKLLNKGFHMMDPDVLICCCDNAESAIQCMNNIRTMDPEGMILSVGIDCMMTDYEDNYIEVA